MFARPVHLLLPALLLLPAFSSSPRAGGWAVITVENLPDHLTAGQPVTLAFSVRQHGMTLLADLRPSIEARSGNTIAKPATARATLPGHYVATLTVPKAGDWTITIHSGFGPSQISLLPLHAVDANVAAVPDTPERERGRRLFVAKGCVTCHVHDETSDGGNRSIAVGPALTGRRYPAAYLAKFLANPAIATPMRPATFNMPNLGLEDREIAALVAFINTDRQLSARGGANGSR